MKPASQAGKGPIFSAGSNVKWETQRVTGCQVVVHEGLHYMFYIGFRDVDHAKIGLARPRNGVTGWHRHPANPIIRPSLDGWDRDAVYKPFAISDGARWLLYNGRKRGAEQFGLAIHDGVDLGIHIRSHGTNRRN